MKQHPWGGVCVQPNTLRHSVMSSLQDTLPKNVILAVYHNLGHVGKLYLSNCGVIPVFTKGILLWI